MSDFEITSMILTSCRTPSMFNVRIMFCLATTAAQTRPVPNVALSSPHEAAIECFLDCLGQLFPLPRRRLVINLAHWGIESSRIGQDQCHRPTHPPIPIHHLSVKSNQVAWSTLDCTESRAKLGSP